MRAASAPGPAAGAAAAARRALAGRSAVARPPVPRVPPARRQFRAILPKRSRRFRAIRPSGAAVPSDPPEAEPPLPRSGGQPRRPRSHRRDRLRRGPSLPFQGIPPVPRRFAGRGTAPTGAPAQDRQPGQRAQRKLIDFQPGARSGRSSHRPGQGAGWCKTFSNSSQPVEMLGRRRPTCPNHFPGRGPATAGDALVEVGGTRVDLRRSRAADRVVGCGGLLAEEQARPEELVAALDEDLVARRVHAANDRVLAPAAESSAARRASSRSAVDGESHELGAPAVGRPRPRALVNAGVVPPTRRAKRGTSGPVR